MQHNLEEGVKVGKQKLMMIGIEKQQGGMYSCRGTNAVGDGQSEPYILEVKCEWIVIILLLLLFLFVLFLFYAGSLFWVVIEI